LVDPTLRQRHQFIGPELQSNIGPTSVCSSVKRWCRDSQHSPFLQYIRSTSIS